MTFALQPVVLRFLAMGVVAIADETSSGEPADAWALEIAEERLTLREVIRRRVFQEVAEYNARLPPVFRGLGQPAGAELTRDGYALRVRRRVDAEAQYRLDLFVGVASIASDPAWEDGGPHGRFVRYWTSYGFGPLDQAAQTRRDLLARLLPRLAIWGACSVEGGYLHVAGTRHSYKIHLGSGNVMITPGNRFLCIVPGRDAGPDLGYLPFEGDLTPSCPYRQRLHHRRWRQRDPAHADRPGCDGFGCPLA